MQFGMPTLIETKDIDECAKLCREMSLQFIELNMNLPQYQLQNIDLGAFAEIAKRNGIYYTIHLDENFNVCDFNPKIAQSYADTAFETIELAKKLDIPIINMHLASGVYFTLPDERIYLFDKFIDTYLKSLESFRGECERVIAGHDIKICIENSDGWNTNFSQKGVELLLESRIFGITFDIGHNKSIGGGDGRIIMLHEDKLCHMHMHDARGTKNHLVLGTGEIDLGKYFALAKKHDLRIVLETKTIDALKQSVGYIRQNAI